MASPHHVSLVYDFLANGTLGDRLRDTGGSVGGDEERQRPQPLRSAGLVRIVKDVVDGMLYLHEVRDDSRALLAHYRTGALILRGGGRLSS